MQTVLRYGSFLVKDVANGSRAVQAGRQTVAWYGTTSGRAAVPWTCEQCRMKLQRRHGTSIERKAYDGVARRTFAAASIRLRDEQSYKKEAIELPGPGSSDNTTSPSRSTSQEEHAPSEETAPSSPPPEPPSGPSEPPLSTPASSSSSLPSAIAQRRWDFSKRMSKLADSLLTKATLASHQINTYTGTDFSGIEALRSEIVEREQGVKRAHVLVSEKKDAHMEAHAKQAASQKEIVSLLERKSNWGPADLERYMSLVRSEHLDEQGVQKAKEDLAVAERELEEGRALLERLERKQYHEEQIWSDTIRRNSTWVTIGLMGVNIFLLLAQILIFEPYRRRKIVKQVKEALDEKSISSPNAEVEKSIDRVVEPKDVAVEALEVKTESAVVEEPVTAVQPLNAVVPETETASEAGATPLAAGEVLPEEALDVTPETAPAPAPAPPPATTKPASLEETLASYQAAFLDLFSERSVQLKQIDVTTIALQGAASGIALMGALFLLFRPH